MSALVTCYPCRHGQHDRCAKSDTRSGVLGGWVCECHHKVCVERRRQTATDTTPSTGEDT